MVNMEPLARSDDLEPLSRLVGQLPVFRDVVGPVQRVALVIDAQIAVGVLSFQVRKTQPDARTDLEEVIASGTVVAYAPDWIDAEIREHLGDYAAKWQVPVATLQKLWDDFRPKLRLCSEHDLDEACGSDEYTRLQRLDPDDLPYALARATVAADAVLTKDHHFSKAGTPAVAAEILIDLRDYARSKAIEVRIKAAATSLTLVAGGLAVGTGKAIAGLARVFGRAPAIVQIGLAVAVLVLLAHPKGRAMIRRSLQTFGVALRNVGEVLEPTAVKVIEEHTAATERAAEAWQRAKERLPARRDRLRLKDVAYGAILGAGMPMRLDEVAAAVLARGYKPRGRNVAPYLRSVLRRDQRLRCGPTGKWSLRIWTGATEEQPPDVAAYPRAPIGWP